MERGPRPRPAASGAHRLVRVPLRARFAAGFFGRVGAGDARAFGAAFARGFLGRARGALASRFAAS